MSDYYTNMRYEFTVHLRTINATGAIVTRILFTRGDGSTGFWNATIINNGKDLFYTTQPGEINMPGKWTFQAYVKQDVLVDPLYGQEFTYFFKTPKVAV